MTKITEPKLGDFGLVSIPGDVGNLIRFGQFLNGDGWSREEHAFVYVGDGQIVEAEPGGALLSAVSKYSNVLWSTDHIPLADEQRAAIAEYAKTLIGTPYSAADYFAITAHRLHLPFSPLLKKFVSDRTHLICSQLVDCAYEHGGVNLFQDGRWNGYVTPGDLAKLLEGTSA